MGSTLMRRLAQSMFRMLRLCSCIVRFSSDSALACSTSVHVCIKSAVAHVRRLDRKQRKGKSIRSLQVHIRNSALLNTQCRKQPFNQVSQQIAVSPFKSGKQRKRNAEYD
jgi:hypothetical protein